MIRIKASASIKFLFVISLLAASILPGWAELEESATLSADSMNYDPRSFSITATGNVHLTAPDGELFADNGVGYTNGRTFEMHGRVKGHFDPESLDISCDSLVMESEGKAPVRRKLIATGSVNLSHRGGRIAAQKLTWEVDSDNYRAAGNVIMDLGDYFIDSDEAARNGEQFWAQNVRRYEDRTRKISISASKASGLLRRDAIIELISSGNFVLNLTDRRGGVTTITGDKGVYSQDRGTLVITGGVRAIQEGRSLSAGSIVYHLDSGRVEALGERPTITFEMRGE